MAERTAKELVQEIAHENRERITRGRNARKWFYRGVLATLAASYAYTAWVQRSDEKEES